MIRSKTQDPTDLLASLPISCIVGSFSSDSVQASITACATILTFESISLVMFAILDAVNIV